MNSLRLVFIGCILLVAFSCCNDDEPTIVDSFDRNVMLTSWADNIIIPAFENYTSDLKSFEIANNNFIANADESNYDALVLSWLEAYKSWQKVAIFDIGKAEEIGLRNFTNIYPTDVDLIESNIESQNYNLELPSNYNAQGFPALDYLFFGTGESKTEIITKLVNPQYEDYVRNIISNLIELTDVVISDWKTNYRMEFISNDGSSATASVDKLVNDFLFQYEKFFRAGKVGIPAGVFSGSKISTSVEAPFSNRYSKELAEEAFKAIRDFFIGLSFEDGVNGVSLDDYLLLVMTQNNTADISQEILSQWMISETKLNDLSNSFKEQIENDNSKMLAFYDELQKAVVLLKVDMLQAINIQVDFVDADGD